MRRTLLVVGIVSLAITANTLQPPSTTAAAKAGVAFPTSQNFVVTNANNNGPGSLRDAIVNANATAGTDTITFNIPGPGVKLISLLDRLPEIISKS